MDYTSPVVRPEEGINNCHAHMGVKLHSFAALKQEQSVRGYRLRHFEHCLMPLLPVCDLCSGPLLALEHNTMASNMSALDSQVTDHVVSGCTPALQHSTGVAVACGPCGPARVMWLGSLSLLVTDM